MVKKHIIRSNTYWRFPKHYATDKSHRVTPKKVCLFEHVEMYIVPFAFGIVIYSGIHKQ